MSSAQWGRVVICAVAALAASVPAVGQEFRATVKGVVVDTSQAALPGATVTVQNQETNEMATATTNEIRDRRNVTIIVVMQNDSCPRGEPPRRMPCQF